MKPTRRKVDIDPKLIPLAITLRRAEYILSGKVKLPVDHLVWAYNELGRLAPGEEGLLRRLREHIQKVKESN